MILASVLFFIIVTVDHNGKWLSPEMKKGSLFYTQISTAFPKIIHWMGTDIRFSDLPLLKGRW